MSTKKEIMASEPSKKTMDQRKVWRAMELMPESEEWPSEKKLELILYYATCGSAKQTCRDKGVPLVTFRSWQRSDWFPEVHGICLDLTYNKIGSKLTGIAAHCAEQLESMVVQGEPIQAADGTVTYRKLGVRDLLAIMNSTLDRGTKLAGIGEAAQAGAEKGERSKLVDLAQACIDVAKKMQHTQAEMSSPKGTFSTDPLSKDTEGVIDAEFEEVPDATQSKT